MDRKAFIGWQVLSILALMALVATGAAANSNTVSYQGVLRNAAQAPVADATYSMRFSIWDDPAAGAKQWGDEDQSVTTRNGLFSVNLGSVLTLGTVFADNAALWLQIEADTGTGTEIYSPRVPLASVPYAQYAKDADSVDGVDFAAHNADTAAHSNIALNAARIVDGTINVLRLPVGTGATEVAAGNHVHNASAITEGTMNIGRLPVGTGAAHVAAGNHTHAANWKVTKAIPYAGSGFTRSGSFSSSAGSTIMIHASATAYHGTAGATMQVDVRVDGTTRGSLRGFTNEGSSHKTLCPDVIVLTGLPAGSHTVDLVLVSGSADYNDYSQVTVHELLP